MVYPKIMRVYRINSRAKVNLNLNVIKKSKIKKLIITDSIDNSNKTKNNSKIEVLSISSLMSEAIKRIANSNSVSDLFN